jgi:bis(5'-nucleosyl)-tetraphosphatase (symmetrical)
LSGRLFTAMYGNEPSLWRDDLEGDDRLRYITNVLTRLRVCDESGRLLLGFKGPLPDLPPDAIPWFRAPRRRWAGARVVCGHWSAVGYIDEGGVLGLDTGCVWGGTLTAQRIDVPSAPVAVPSTLPATY